MSYADFIASKARRAPSIGRTVELDQIHPSLFDWQRAVVQRAVRVGRHALFEDAGLGKTRQQVEFARLSADTSLILAPLAVTAQTVREAAAIDVEARYVRSPEQIDGPGVYVTNYEMADRFDPSTFGAVVLDESSILANVDGKTRQRLTELLRAVPHRLACTATPMPNDIAELTNHAEFLGVASRPEMLAAYFVNDQKDWRLKGHAAGPMFDWMATWAVAMRRPSDLGYPDDGYELPPLRIVPQLIDVQLDTPGQLFTADLGGVGGRAKVRRHTLDARVARTAEIVAAEPDEPWIVWCGLNDEANAITRELGDGAVNVEGSWAPEAKAEAILAFIDGDISTLVTKINIAGFGLNLQHCARQAFLGMNDSWQGFYQAIRRSYRFGQTREVVAHLVLSELEGQIATNVARKEREAGAAVEQLVSAMRRAWVAERTAA